jgi:hypothetical protein
VFRSLSQIMSLEREVEEGREKERQLERERHDMERQINARSETFHHFTQFCGSNMIYDPPLVIRIRAQIQPSMWIGIRIRMFLGLPYPRPDSLVTSTDLASDPSIIKQK